MTLAKTIIFGNVENLQHALAQHVELNKIDEYGYTPLIQAAIVNSLNKAKLLIDAGAEIDFTDLTGRTALHWAADNNNLELAEYLLERKADPNAYSLAGQPVLVLPYLRQQEPMKRLLYRYGANIHFAQDFINAKQLGHVYELEGRIDITDPKKTFFEVEFEGFYLEFNLAIVTRSLMDFNRHYAGKQLRRHYQQIQSIITALAHAAELSKYQHYLIDAEDHRQVIKRLLNIDPLVIPVSYSGHAICMIKYKDWFVRCDRGAYGKKHGTVIFYRAEEPARINHSLCKTLMYQRQDKAFIEEGMVQALGLEVVDTLPLPVQISGNCSWANIEAVVPALMFLLHLEEKPTRSRAEVEELKKIAMETYEQWTEWDKTRSLHFCLETIKKCSVLRKAAKAAMLAAILFQRCEYSRVEDRQKAEKILPILAEPEFDYILKAYFKVFGKEKDHQQFKNLLEFLEEFGIDKRKFSR